MLTWLRTFLKSNTWHINLWLYLCNTLFLETRGVAGASTFVDSPIRIRPGARARTGLGKMSVNQINPQMSAFHWFSADLSDIVQSNSPGPRPEMVQVPRPSPRPSLFSSEDPSLARLLPRLSSPDFFFLGLPPQGQLSGVHILNPMTVQTPRNDPPGPGLAPRRTALPIPISTRYRCTFRTHRVQPDGSYRCMRDGATFIPSLQDSDLGAHVCTRHRALARRYTELNMNWTYEQPRQSLDNTRASNGRFGSNLNGEPVPLAYSTPLVPPGMEAAVITVFKSDFLDQQHIDWHLAESGTTCPICLDEENSATTDPHVRLQCGHGMHLRCLSDFVLSGAVDLAADIVPCPLCRGDILPDIVQLRHHLMHMKVVRPLSALRDLVFEDGHDPSTTETMIDQEIKAFCVHPGPVKYISSKNPGVICDNWGELNVDTITDPTEEIMDMVRPATPIRRPAPPPVDQTTPPAFVNLTHSPPPTPRPDRRVRRRLLDQDVRTNSQEFPAHVIQLGPGTRARVEEVPGSTARVIGLNLSEIDRSTNTGVHVLSGYSLSGNTRYTLTVLDVLVPGSGSSQRQVSITIDDAI